jgi:hypothetical protein
MPLTRSTYTHLHLPESLLPYRYSIRPRHILQSPAEHVLESFDLDKAFVPTR